jgi:hypothetical protein
MKTKKNILLFVSFLCLFSCITIEKDVEIKGIVTWDYWKAHSGWRDCEGKNLFIDYNKLDKLNEMLAGKNYSFIVFATAFCSHCEEEVPKIFRVFKETGVKPENILLVGLDKSYNEPSGTYKKYNVRMIPSVIVFREKKEIGRVYGTFKDIIDNLIEILEGK